MSVAALPTKETGDRHVFVDALRGVAAVAVVVSHLFLFRWLLKSTDEGFFGGLSEVASYGVRGVQIFFVISGFVT